MKAARSDAASARAGPRRGRPKLNVDSPPKTRSSPGRSPARTRKPSPPASAPTASSRSPGRKSPARRSPARNASSKVPARKSPSRPAESKSPSRRAAIRSEEPVELKQRLSEPIVRIGRPRRSEYSIKDLSVGLNQVEVSIGDRLNGLENKKERVPRATVAPQMIRRTSARLRDSASQPSGSSRVSESASRSIDFALDDSQDEDEPSHEKSALKGRKLATPMHDYNVNKNIASRLEFGGRLGSAVLLILLPACVFSVLVACARSCAFRLPQPSLPSLPAVFSLRSAAIVAAQVCLQTLFSFVNVFGRRVNRGDESGCQQYFNGLFSNVLTVSIVFAADYFNVLSRKVILEEYLRLAILFYVLAVLLAVILYVKSRKMSDDKLNPYGNTGFLVYDFWIGREIFPQIGKIDVKVLLQRICNTNGLIISLLLFSRGVSLPQDENLKIENYKDLLSNLRFDHTILAITTMQLTYILNSIINDHKITSTFTWQSEGVGYLQIVSSALYPFYFLVVSKFVVENRVSLPANVLVGAGLLYAVGFSLYLISNNIKHDFRKNPAQKKFKDMEAMPTFLGKRLMTSGLWGLLRHPNYLGDVLLHLAMAAPGLWAHPNVAAVPVATTIIALCHRAVRDNARCKRRYGAAWQRYTVKVPKAIIPKVF